MNNLKEINIKNCTCYYFDDIANEKFDFDNILLDGKLHENILVHGFSYKVLIGGKSLCINFDKVD